MTTGSKTSAHAADRDQVVRLQSTYLECSSNILTALAVFRSDLENFMLQMQNACDEIKQCLDEAKEKLDKARSRLHRCLNSQHYDDDGNLTPSCSIEYSNVASCQAKVDKWQKKYDEACKLKDNCKHEISKYGKDYCPPYGVEKLLSDAAGENTKQAKASLDDILDNIDRILSTPMNIPSRCAPSHFTPTESSRRAEEVAEADKNDIYIKERYEIFDAGIEETKEEIISDIKYNYTFDLKTSSKTTVERFKEGGQKIKELSEEQEKKRLMILKKIADDNGERGARERERINFWLNNQNQR